MPNNTTRLLSLNCNFFLCKLNVVREKVIWTGRRRQKDAQWQELQYVSSQVWKCHSAVKCRNSRFSPSRVKWINCLPEFKIHIYNKDGVLQRFSQQWYFTQPSRQYSHTPTNGHTSEVCVSHVVKGVDGTFLDRCEHIYPHISHFRTCNGTFEV